MDQWIVLTIVLLLGVGIGYFLGLWLLAQCTCGGRWSCAACGRVLGVK